MTDRQVLDTLLRGADPVPNPADPPSGAWSADVALLEIERRSETMQTQERPTETAPVARPPWRQRPMLVAAAVFVAVLVVVGAALTLINQQGPEVVEPPPTTVAPTTAAPTTTPAPTSEAPTTTTTPTTTEAPALGAAFRIGGLEAGTYHAADFATPFFLEIPEGWRGERADEREIRLSSTERPALFNDETAYWGIQIAAYRATESAEEIARDLSEELPLLMDVSFGQVVVGATGDTILGGAAATWQEADNTDGSENPWRTFSVYLDIVDGNITNSGAAGDFGDLGISPLHRARYYVVDGPTGAFVIIAQAPTAEWDEFLTQAEALLATIAFQPPAAPSSLRIGGLDAGVYRAADFDVPFLLEVPDGWRGERADSKEIRISSTDRPSEFNDELAHWSIVFTAYRAADPADDVAGDFADEAGQSEVLTSGAVFLVDQGEVTVGAARALYVDVDNTYEDSDNRMFATYVDLANGDARDYFEATGTQASDFGFLGLDAQYRNRYYAIDGADGTILVMIQAPIAEWDEFLPIAESVLQTMNFEQ